MGGGISLLIYNPNGENVFSFSSGIFLFVGGLIHTCFIEDCKAEASLKKDSFIMMNELLTHKEANFIIYPLSIEVIIGFGLKM